MQIAILYFPNDNFNISALKNAVARYEGVGKSNGKGYVEFKEILCIGNNKILFRKKATQSGFLAHQTPFGTSNDATNIKHYFDNKNKIHKKFILRSTEY